MVKLYWYGIVQAQLEKIGNLINFKAYNYQVIEYIYIYIYIFVW